MGSSSTSSCGVVEDRLHDADERALARRQLHAHAVGEVGDLEALEALVDGGLAGLPAHAVEAGEDRQGLAHPQPVGEREVAGDEADLAPWPRERPLGRSWPTTVIEPASGVMAPRSMRSVVVLPAPFGPSSATRSPAPMVRSTPSTARTFVEGLHEAAGFEDVPHRERVWPRTLTGPVELREFQPLRASRYSRHVFRRGAHPESTPTGHPAPAARTAPVVRAISAPRRHFPIKP